MKREGSRIKGSETARIDIGQSQRGVNAIKFLMGAKVASKSITLRNSWANKLYLESARILIASFNSLAWAK